MNRKGFTLIELLAVIIILAIIMLIAIPSVTNYINNSRKETYADTAKELLRGAGNLVNSGELDIYDPETTYYIPSTCIKTESGGNSPYGKFNPAYIITTYDGDNYNYYWTSTDEANMGVPKPVKGDELSKEHIIPNVDTISTDYGVGNRENIQVFNADCSDSTSKIAIGKYDENDLNGRITPVKNCEFTGDMVQGAEFIEGQYTYRYKQGAAHPGSGLDWGNTDADGWGVMLTDKTTSAPITTELCTKINGKPIVMMSNMFANAENISYVDVSSFDTSHVTNMSNMFGGTFKNTDTIEIEGLEYFDISNVEYATSMFGSAGSSNITKVDLNMSGWTFKKARYLDPVRVFAGAFYDVQEVNLNLSNWKYENMIQITNVFSGSFGNTKKINIDMSNWKFPQTTSFATTLANIGYNSDEITLNVTGWEFPHVTSLYELFYSSGSSNGKFEIKGIGTWDISHVTDLSRMFVWVKGKTMELDLSNWDVSNVTSFASMFRNFCSGISPTKVKLIMKNWKIKPNANLFDMYAYSFYGCQDLEIDMSGWDLTGTTSIADITGYTSGGLKNILVNMSNWKTSTFTNIDKIFQESFSSAETIVYDVTGWDTSNVTSAKNTFHKLGGYSSANVTIRGIEGWDLRNCADTSYMFAYINSLSLNNLHIYSYNTYCMFEGINNLSGSITLHNNPTDYRATFYNSNSNTTFRVNYTSAVTDIDNIMNTKGYNPSPNIIKGNQV